MSSVVYYIETTNEDSIKSVSKKLGTLVDKSGILKFIKKDGFTGIKLHFGDEGNTGHIRHEWVKAILDRLTSKTKNVFLTDSNVLYKRSLRTNSVDHLKIAHEHGFSIKNIGVPILIADGIFGRNFIEVEIDKKHFSKVKIASDIASCDSLLVLSHLTGHMQTGLAGALKNLGMGCASRRGKYEQHCGIVPEVNPSYCTGCGLCQVSCPAACIIIESKEARILSGHCIGCGECVVVCRTRAIDTKWSETLENLQEKMVEYAYGVMKALKGEVGYINFLIKVTKDCDCLMKNAPRIVPDLGILASEDPVSIDKASADLLNEFNEKDVFKNGYPDIDWAVQLKHASRIGLGSLSYKLKRL